MTPHSHTTTSQALTTKQWRWVIQNHTHDHKLQLTFTSKARTAPVPFFPKLTSLLPLKILQTAAARVVTFVVLILRQPGALQQRQSVTQFNNPSALLRLSRELTCVDHTSRFAASSPFETRISSIHHFKPQATAIMKVAEKASDRTAEVHLRVEGQAKALKEYGEYISSEDTAICCYVPVENGDTIKIEGRFSGTVCKYSANSTQKLIRVTDVGHQLRCRC